MSRRGAQQTIGRYSGSRAASSPGELPNECRDPSRPHLEIVHAVVDDPNPTFRGERQRVAVNKNTDALEREHKYGRISESAYRAGRVYGLVLEKSGGAASGGGQWMEGDRVDAVLAHEVAILLGIDRARVSVAMLTDTLKVVGMLGQRILYLVLIKRLTLENVCEEISGRTDKLARNFYAETFRQSLQSLADHWSSPQSRWPSS